MGGTIGVGRGGGKQRLACVLGHTIITQTFVYSKYSKDLYPH